MEKLAFTLMDLIVLRKEAFEMKEENPEELITDLKKSFTKRSRLC